MMLLEIKDMNRTYTTDSRMITGFGMADVGSNFRMHITLGIGRDERSVDFTFTTAEARDAAYKLVTSRFDPMPPKPIDPATILLKLQSQFDKQLSVRDQMALEFASVHYKSAVTRLLQPIGPIDRQTITSSLLLLFKEAYAMADAMIAEGQKKEGRANATAEPVPSPVN